MRSRILIATACGTLLLLYIARAVSMEASGENPFEVLGPIPSDIKKTRIYLNLDQVYDDPNKGYKGPDCLRYRSAVYDDLKGLQREMHATLGQNFRHAIKEAEKEKAATKDPKRKKQIGEWETKLSVAVQQMNKQIDQDYEAAVKKVHFKVRCSDK
jgi:hypothetical protein